jgi:hypothetical protein
MAPTFSRVFSSSSGEGTGRYSVAARLGRYRAGSPDVVTFAYSRTERGVGVAG